MCYVCRNGYVQQSNDVYELLNCMVNERRLLVVTIKGKYKRKKDR